jgi:ATP-dependent Clp protease protease subunit
MRQTRLLQLLRDNRGINAKARGARITASANGGEATLYLYDVIVGSQLEAEWFGGVCPQDLVPQLDQLQASTIHLRINSPGGDVFAAQAIASALERHPANVIAHIDGLAASAATAIAVVCDEVLIAPAAMFMIHNAWTLAMGDRNDLLDTAALLEKVDGTLAAKYAARTGMKAEEVAALMDAETWYTGQEAVDAGFADGLDGEAEPDEDDRKASALWNLAAFEKAPAAARAAPAAVTDDAPTVADYERRARVKALTRLPA